MIRIDRAACVACDCLHHIFIEIITSIAHCTARAFLALCIYILRRESLRSTAYISFLPLCDLWFTWFIPFHWENLNRQHLRLPSNGRYTNTESITARHEWAMQKTRLQRIVGVSGALRSDVQSQTCINNYSNTQSTPNAAWTVTRRHVPGETNYIIIGFGKYFRACNLLLIASVMSGEILESFNWLCVVIQINMKSAV